MVIFKLYQFHGMKKSNSNSALYNLLQQDSKEFVECMAQINKKMQFELTNSVSGGVPVLPFGEDFSFFADIYSRTPITDILYGLYFQIYGYYDLPAFPPLCIVSTNRWSFGFRNGDIREPDSLYSEKYVALAQSFDKRQGSLSIDPDTTLWPYNVTTILLIGRDQINAEVETASPLFRFAQVPDIANQNIMPKRQKHACKWTACT